METKTDGSISSELEALLSRLTTEMIRFVIARAEIPSDKDAAAALEMKPATVKRWKYDGYPIDEAVRAMALDGMTTALHLRRRVLGKAMAVKAAGLDHDDPKVRQAAATEIIEWELGKAAQPVQAEVRPNDEFLALLKALESPPCDGSKD